MWYRGNQLFLIMLHKSKSYGTVSTNTPLISHRVFLPAVSQAGPQFLMHHHLLHVLQRWVLTHLLLKGEHVLIYWSWKHVHVSKVKIQTE